MSIFSPPWVREFFVFHRLVGRTRKGVSTPGYFEPCNLPSLTAGLPGKSQWVSFNRAHESKSEVPQACPTVCEPMDCSPPGSSVHWILQARILEWVAISFSRGSSRPRDRTWVSHIGSRCFNLWATREAPDNYLNHGYYVPLTFPNSYLLPK